MDEENQQGGKKVLDYVTVFLHRKWLFIIPLLVGAVGGLAVSMGITEKFSSTTLVLVEEQQVPEEYVTPTDRTPFSQRLNIITQQILSRTRLEQIIREFALYEGGTGGFAQKAVSIATGSREEAPTPDDIIYQMRQDISFMVVGESGSRKGQTSGGNAFTITYRGTDPETTRQVTDRLASLFIEENLKVREEYAEGASEFLSAELSRAQAEVAGLEERMKEFKQSNMGTLPEQQAANLGALERLQAELQTVTASIKNNEDRRAVLEEQMRYAPAGIAPKSSLAADLESAKAELNQLLYTYKESYPDVAILRKRIKDLESRLAAEAAELKKEKKATPAEVLNPAYGELMGVRSQLTTLRQRETSVRRQVTDYERRIAAAPSVEQKQADLMRDYQTSLDNYNALLEKKMSAGLAVNLEKVQKGARFRVIDPANLPQGADYPNKPLVASIGAASGAAFGIALVFVFEFLNPAFRKPEDFEGIVDSPVLTSIPMFPLEEKAGAEPRFRVIKGRNASA